MQYSYQYKSKLSYISKIETSWLVISNFRNKEINPLPSVTCFQRKDYYFDGWSENLTNYRTKKTLDLCALRVLAYDCSEPYVAKLSCNKSSGS